MSMGALLLASGRGWRVDDFRCTSGPRDRPFEERHDGMCIAIVTSGTFTYRTTQGTAVLAPGAALLGITDTASSADTSTVSVTDVSRSVSRLSLSNLLYRICRARAKSLSRCRIYRRFQD